MHPFSDTTGVDHLLREANEILSPNSTVKKYNASRIWGFISKFVMLDRFIKALGIAEDNPGVLVPRTLCEVDYLGSGLKVSIFLLKLRHPASTNMDLRS